MQFDPTGFQRVFALQGDAELAQAHHHHHFDPTGGLGAPVRCSSDYCMADTVTACGWAEDWMIKYLRETHHLTWATIEQVRLHLTGQRCWSAYRFLDAINPGSEHRVTLDLTVAQLRTAQDVAPSDNALLCASLLEYGEDQCRKHLGPDKAARVLDQFLKAMLLDIKSAARSVIDAMIQAEIQASLSSASAAAPE
jgi:hypothetical protein